MSAATPKKSQRAVRRRRWALFLGLAVVAVACSGSGLTTSAYFDRVGESTATLDQAMDDLGATYKAELNTSIDTLRLEHDLEDRSELAAFVKDLTEIAISKTIVWLDASTQPLRDFLEALQATDPPQDMRAGHDALIDATQRALGALPDTMEQVRQVSTIDDLAVVVENSSFAEATETLRGVCSALQTVAQDEDIEQTLECFSDAE